MKKPNFFILGAPKCGTTSLAAWLAEHPQVYIPQKEIHHFSTDLKSVWAPDRQQYQALFAKACDQQEVLGEASVLYLYSREAVPNIEAYCEQPLYIVCLRNPIDMVYSLHEQMLFAGFEHVDDFERAWELNDARQRGEQIAPWCTEPKYLFYKEICSLGAQMERLFETIPRQRVHVVLLDDVKQAPACEYRKVLRFLHLDDDGRTNFSIHNPAKRNRFPWLRRVTMALGKIKKCMGLDYRFGILKWLDKCNMQYRSRPPLSAEMRCLLRDSFRTDIEKLAVLLERDFSDWLEE